MFFVKKKYDKLVSAGNIWVLMLPFLILYLIISIITARSDIYGDEIRYLTFAKNLLGGFFSPPPPNIDLWSGPGYPMFIAIPLLSQLPIVFLRLLNAVLLYLALINTFQTLKEYTSHKNSLISTIMLGLYFPIFELLSSIYTEILTWFLISLICLLFTRTLKNRIFSWKYILVTAIAISYLALTKVIFGYVILMMIAISSLLLLNSSFRDTAKKSLLIFTFALAFCLPYLAYTYSLTGKIFYWANSGGMSLYTMSTPYPGEFGDWTNSKKLAKNPNHAEFMETTITLPPLERDEAFRKQAIENIKAHPKKYAMNLLANVGRLLFSYPYSDGKQTIGTYFTIIPNMFVVVIIFLSLGIGLRRHKEFPIELVLLLAFILIYLGGSSLVSAYRRMFYITMPFWTVFISYVFTNIISIKYRSSKI